MKITKLLTFFAILIFSVSNLILFPKTGLASTAQTVYFTTNGTFGSTVSIGSGVNEYVSCVTTNFCMAVSNSGNATEFTGTWQTPVVIPGSPDLFGISCPTTSFCVAVENGPNSYIWSGGVWNISTINSGDYFRSISCASVSLCLASDYQGNIYLYNGINWSFSTTAPYQADISCVDTTFCMAVAGTGSWGIYNSGVWSNFSPFSPSGYVASISCSSSNFCLGISNTDRNVAFLWNGTNWTNNNSAFPGFPVDPSTVSCVPGVPGLCYISIFNDINGSQNTEVYMYNQGTSVLNSNSLYNNPAVSGEIGISCVSSSFCETVTNSVANSYQILGPSGATVGGSGYTPSATATSGLIPVITVDSSASSVCSISSGVVSYTGAGTCILDANQSGNGTYSPALQAQESFTVSPVSTSINLQSSVNPILLGNTVDFTAILTDPGGYATGNIVFTQNGNTICTIPIITVGGQQQAVCSYQETAVNTGGVAAQATYAGNGSYYGSVSNTVSEIVNKDSTNIIVTAVPSTSTAGDTVNFDSTVLATSPGVGTPTGNVTFYENGQAVVSCTNVVLVNGNASCSLVMTMASNTSVYAVYNGDSNYNTSTSNVVNESVGKDSTITTLTTSSATVYTGTLVHYTVQVVSYGNTIPSGTVTFTENGNPIVGCSQLSISASGNAVCSVSYANTEYSPWTIEATYSGDVNDNGSSSNPVTETVLQTRYATSIMLNSSNLNPPEGMTVTFTATITGVSNPPTGVVNFEQNGQTFCQNVVVNNNKATCSYDYSSLNGSPWSVMAIYNGDFYNLGSSSNTVTEIVQKVYYAPTITITSNSNSPHIGDHITFSIVVHGGYGTPTGEVSLQQNGQNLCENVVLNNGIAYCSVTVKNEGKDTFFVQYTGDNTYQQASAYYVIQVNKNSSLIQLVFPKTGQAGSSENIFVVIQEKNGYNPTGKVQIISNNKTVCNINLSVTNSCNVVLSSAGNISYTVIYSGDANYAPSEQFISINSIAISSTTTLSSRGTLYLVDKPIKITAAVHSSNLPIGTVQFFANNKPISGCENVVLQNGQAICSTSFSTPGTVNFSAVYSGDVIHAQSNSNNLKVNFWTGYTIQMQNITGTATQKINGTVGTIVNVALPFGYSKSQLDTLIYWGDGTNSKGIIVGKDIKGSHVYKKPGNYVLSIVMTYSGITVLDSSYTMSVKVINSIYGVPVIGGVLRVLKGIVHVAQKFIKLALHYWIYSLFVIIILLSLTAILLFRKKKHTDTGLKLRF